MTGLITLTVAGIMSGPFNIYSNVDGYLHAFDTNITRDQLLNGYPTANIPNGTTIVRISSTGACFNYIDIVLSGSTTTTSSSSTSTTTTIPPITFSPTVIGWAWNVDTVFADLYTSPGNNSGPEAIASMRKSNAGSYTIYRTFLGFPNTADTIPISISLSFYVTSIVNVNIPNNNLYFKCNNTSPNLNTAVSFLDFQEPVPGIAASNITPVVGWNTVVLDSSVMNYFRTSNGDHCNIRISHNSDENMIAPASNNDEGSVIIDYLVNIPYITVVY